MTFDLPGSKLAKPAEPTFSAEDLASAVEEARKETALDVEARTRAAVNAELSHRQTMALEAIRDQLGVLEAGFLRRSTDIAATAQSLARMMGQAVVPKALERHPLADIAEMLRQALLRLVDQASVEIRLEADLVDQMTELSKRLADESGFQGALNVVADPAMSAGDAKLVWTSGSADRDLGCMKEEVDMLVEAWFADSGFTGSGSGDDADGSIEDQPEGPSGSPETESERSEEGCAS